ncbi:MAG: hypothetical protein N2B06_17355 [Clostridium sp.]
MFSTLSYIGKKLNEEGVVWGVGASILLNHYGLIVLKYLVNNIVITKGCD